jgi:hypothetical protein
MAEEEEKPELVEEEQEVQQNVKKNIVKRFKKSYKEFIKDFSKSFPEHSEKAKDAYINIDNWYDFVLQFVKKMEPYILNISQKDESLFIDNKITIIENIESSLIWKDISLTNKEIIWKYLQTLYILGITYNDGNSLNTILESINNINNQDSIENLNDQAKIIIDMFKNISLNENGENGESSNKEESSGENFKDGLEDMLNNSKIANLAKELSEEIKIDGNLTDPAEIIGNLTNDPSKMFDLIKTIGGKIQDKISTGSLSEGDLINEAQTMFSKLSNGNMFNNDILKNMAKGMGGMNFGNMFNDDKNRANKNSERLKKKLEEKKKFMERLEKQQKELENNNSEDKNKIIDEIENNNNNNNIKKKKNKK